MLTTLPRSYAHKYRCPQIFCFDGVYLLMLQFRINKSVDDIRLTGCAVDCWVVPRENHGRGCTLRYALYRFLV